MSGIDYRIFENYRKNRILFTAEHAFPFDIPKPEYGEGAHFGVGERNIDRIARLMASTIKSAYITFNLPRTHVDASRPIETLGKDETLLVTLVKDKKLIKKDRVLIHQNTDLVGVLKKYHDMIEELNPRMIVSLHGIGRRHKSDIVFGFGKQFEIFGNEKLALEFFSKVKNNIKEQVEDLKVRISRKHFTGHKNYVLWKHVVEHNKKNKDKRVGCQIEFNRRGRVDEKTKLLTDEYKISSMIIAKSTQDFLVKSWSSFN